VIGAKKTAFLGKGGSGKSTMATALVRALRARGIRVLAIDADHNMDLSFNLGADPSLFLGADPDLIKEHLGVARSGTFAAALVKGRGDGAAFALSPADAFTARVSAEIEDGLRLMTAGPHTDRVRSQEACSHSLAAPLKAYLPLLRLAEDEAVVIDERAGTDPVATGILAGVDLAVIVREPTVHSRRVAEQVARELGIANVPHLVVDNKVDGMEADTARAVERILAFG
jgi:CO dehydrogenase maturation factor